MSIVTIIEPPKQVVLSAVIAGSVADNTQELYIDATVNETFSQSARMTELNVEDGSVINDHIIMGPEELEVEGIVSDTPVDLNPNPFATFGAGFTGLFEEGGPEPKLPSQSAYEFLRDHMKEKSSFNVTTGRDYYIGYYITSLRMPRTERTGRATEFSIRMQKLNIIDLAAGAAGVSDVISFDDSEVEPVEP